MLSSRLVNEEFVPRSLVFLSFSNLSISQIGPELHGKDGRTHRDVEEREGAASWGYLNSITTDQAVDLCRPQFFA